VLSPAAVASDIALKEVAHAASLNKRLAPIVCQCVNADAIPDTLRRLNFIFFDDPASFEASANKLAEALQTDIGWFRQHTEYGEAARRWSAAGRPGGFLLRSPALDVAEHWSTSRPRGAPTPTEETLAFVAASRQGARSAQRLRRLVQIVIYTLLLGIITGLVGWINQSYIKEQLRWYVIVRPFIQAKVLPHVLTAEVELALKPKDTFRECAAEQGKDYCPEMVVIPAGSFLMGASLDEEGNQWQERPQHNVTIAKPFAVSKFEQTFAEWDGTTTKPPLAAIRDALSTI
jgi:hypothetical protein